MAVVFSGHQAEPEPGGFSPAVLVAAVVLAVAITAAVVYSWRSPELADAHEAATAVSSELATSAQQISALEAEVASLEAERDRLRDDVAATQARLEHVVLRAGGLEGNVGSLQAKIDKLLARLEEANGQLDAVTAELGRTHDRLTDARGDASTAHERVVVAAGPALADGRYLGAIEGIDATNLPYRLAMRVTARSNRAPLANAGWRVFVMAPRTLVALTTWRDGRDVTLTPWAFEHVFDGDAPWNVEMRSKRYVIRVNGGRVVAIAEVEPRPN